MTCRTYAIEDSIRYFPFGSARVLNLTGVDVIGAIDGQVIHLPQAKASEHFKLNNGERIEVAIAAQSSARHHLLYKNTLSLNPTARSILILRPPKRSGSVKIQGQLLIEYTPDAKASSKE